MLRISSTGHDPDGHHRQAYDFLVDNMFSISNLIFEDEFSVIYEVKPKN